MIQFLLPENRGGFLKYFFCLAGSPKSVIVATNSAPNFDLKKSTHIYQMSIPVNQNLNSEFFFIIFLRIPRFLNQ